MITFWRIMQAGGRNFMRNAWLSTAATAVMTVTLIIVIVSLVSNLALSSTVQRNVTDKIDISLFLRSDITQDQLQDFQQHLKADANVESVTYISKDEAVAQFRKQHPNDPQTQDALTFAGNNLPASLEVKAKDPNKLGEIEQLWNQPQYKALLDPEAAPSYSGSNKDTINRINAVANFFRSGGLTASGIFVVISMLIIFNTIRMAIFTRRDEIEIMKLVGATKGFIRGPFIVEGATYGVIAAIITLVLTFTTLLSLPHQLGPLDLSGAIDTFSANAPLVVLANLLTGIAIGAASSVLAMSRYLKL